MKRTSITILIAFFICQLATAQVFNKLIESIGGTAEATSSSSLNEEEIARGLKEALNIGVKKGVNQLSKTDGYFKNPEIRISFPDEIKEVERGMQNIGQGELVDKAVKSLNRAAEDAVVGAKDIFINAIASMTLTDALGILRGGDAAATRYLEKTTRLALVEKFKPTVKKSLNKVGATKYWSQTFSMYNKIPFVAKVNPDLVDYVTNKTIDGLFVQIAKEERLIRKNPAARVTDLLKRVFEN